MAALVAASPLLAWAGCGGPSQARPEGARAVLEQALDAWRDGRPPGGLTGPAAGIRVGEPRWDEGFRLEGYEIGEEVLPAGLDLQFTVALSMRDPRGEPVEETARYVVSVRPARTVVRSAFSPSAGNLD